MKHNVWFKFVYRSVSGVLFVFILTGIITLSNFKLDTNRINLNLGNIKTENILINLIRAENHYFYQINESEKEFFTMKNMADTVFHIITNIKPTDARTFLGNELPGLHLFNTEIIVAGEGTNLATLPYESSPPMEVLLKERQIVEENLKQIEDRTNQPQPSGQEKTVFIYQTHSWESFLPYIKNPETINDAISEDKRINVVGLGQRLSENLLNADIGVEHNTTNMTQELNQRDWDPILSYSLSGSIVKASLNKNKKLKYFIDIHRDSARRKITTKEINGKSYAKVFFIVGKENKNYEQNLVFVKELNSRLEKKYPGISRGVVLKPKSEGNGIYNQDISDKAILLEVGGVDNNLDELTRTIDVFSEVFADYYWELNEAQEVMGDGK